MKSTSILCIFTLATLLCVCLSAEVPASSCPITLSQSIRSTWTDNSGSTQYLYDITIQNTGSGPVTTPNFFIKSADGRSGTAITQTWNLVVYATTVPSQVLVSIPPNTQIAAGSSYTAAGYVTNGTQTVLVLDSCVAYTPASSGSTTASSAATTAPSRSSTTTASSAATSAPSHSSTTTGSSSSTTSPTQSCSDISLTQTLRTSYISNGQTFNLYDITITNEGTSSIYTPLFIINSSSGNIQSTWNLVTYASTVQGEADVSINPTQTLAPGQSYTGAGYIFSGVTTLSFPMVDGSYVCN